MQTQHVRYFLAVCDELNFTRAAKKCGISQPALTNAVKRLEREVGAALFLRSPRRPHVEMTALARKLHPTYVQLDTLLAELGGSNKGKAAD
jgi:LysR family hydrogen peroxide-inducible transcriptional activator